MSEQLNIALGLGAKSRVWKNQTWLWSDLVNKLTTEYKTTETYAEFMAASKDEQSKIKDVGGYVGGYLRAGRRKPENVVHRQLLTLDIDFAHLDFWADFTLQFSNAAVLHGTHKHSENTPRYRLVMPLDREVSPDEYVAIARQVAGYLGIELFDNTTFETNRLMFWPSSPSDVVYYAEEQKGPWLCADEILESYIDWTDSSLWPTATKVIDELKSTAKKQENPAEKKGILGAFCRAYGITETIEKFLQAEYAPASDGRFTYLKGSAAAGLIIYDDLFAYSHHGTDPSSHKLCNAFDLVRIHKFGHLDAKASFRAMEDLARKDDKVKLKVAAESFQESTYDFAGPLDEESDNLDWMKELELDARGAYVSSANNLNIIFTNDARFGDIFKQNDFDNKRYVFGDLPWRKVRGPEVVKNVDYSGVRNYIESIYGIVGALKIDDSLALEFEKHSFHPIREYLDSLVWDGVKRIDTLLIKYFGAADNLYTREAMRKTLVGAVARVKNPGVKFDLVLTLISGQGTGKSTFINKLGREWFSDTFLTVQGKEALEQIQGAWLIEMAELSGLRKAEVESVKHFISKQEDTFRPAYARTSETYKRQCIFIGTTNKKQFLSDPSGNRRFMPVDIHDLKLADNPELKAFFASDEEINQVWAEAVELYQAGETLFLSKQAEVIAFEEQKAHNEIDEREGLITKFLDAPIPESWAEMDIFARRLYFENDELTGEPRDYVCMAEVWCECLGKQKEDMSRYNTREVNEIMRGLDGWEASKSTKNFGPYGKQKYYARKLY